MKSNPKMFNKGKPANTNTPCSFIEGSHLNKAYKNKTNWQVFLLF